MDMHVGGGVVALGHLVVGATGVEAHELRLAAGGVEDDDLLTTGCPVGAAVGQMQVRLVHG